ncbi:hypothetical protein MLD38_007491 [Melastoma candidum]|uniref:Uncharacterized protein n=1 Tax=Melastoma candidum TaxID=119954 RepID=A0ACB9RQS9_9MYRT|nr:hypothetical protein MLD38_007491 [Melastoma candidum]
MSASFFPLVAEAYDSRFNGWGSCVTEQAAERGGLWIFSIGEFGASIVVLVAAMTRFSHQRGLTDGLEASMPEGSVESVVQEVGDNMTSG